jgi:hypothetical protein
MILPGTLPWNKRRLLSNTRFQNGFASQLAPCAHDRLAASAASGWIDVAVASCLITERLADAQACAAPDLQAAREHSKSFEQLCSCDEPAMRST